jgi:chromosome segregation ATPase
VLACWALPCPPGEMWIRVQLEEELRSQRDAVSRLQTELSSAQDAAHNRGLEARASADAVSRLQAERDDLASQVTTSRGSAMEAAAHADELRTAVRIWLRLPCLKSCPGACCVLL